MKWTNVLSVVATGFILVAANPAVAANLLANPGFEDPVTSDGPPFIGSWEAFNGGSTASATNSTISPRTGAMDLNLTITASDNNFAGAFQDVLVSPGQSVVWSVWAKKNTAILDLDNEQRIEWRNSVSNTEISRTPNLVSTSSITSDYTLFSLSATVPAGVDTARAVYAIQTFSGGPTNTGTVLVDDASFTAVPEPATVSIVCIGALGLVLRRRR